MAEGVEERLWLAIREEARRDSESEPALASLWEYLSKTHTHNQHCTSSR